MGILIGDWIYIIGVDRGSWPVAPSGSRRSGNCKRWTFSYGLQNVGRRCENWNAIFAHLRTRTLSCPLVNYEFIYSRENDGIGAHYSKRFTHRNCFLCCDTSAATNGR